jgi:PIN domain nuclease of toxin-antitoxin system
MNYVLDTCSYLWLVDDQAQLSPAAVRAIAHPETDLFVSAITVTEVHRLIRKGVVSIKTTGSVLDWFRQGLAQHEVACAPITLEIADAAENLPWIHKDPADRFIMAAAQMLGAEIIMPDSTIPKYPGIRVVW